MFTPSLSGLGRRRWVKVLRGFQALSTEGLFPPEWIAGLAEWLLQGNPGWDLTRIKMLKQTGEQITVPVNRSTAVYFAYISAWATPDGVVHFRPDIYNEDGGAYASAL